MDRPMYLRTGPKFVLVVLVNFWVRERVEDLERIVHVSWSINSLRFAQQLD